MIKQTLFRSLAPRKQTRPFQKHTQLHTGERINVKERRRERKCFNLDHPEKRFLR